MADLKQRAAELNDLKGIWGLLRQTANDIPFDLESEANQENILTELMACCTSGLSPILLDENKAIIGGDSGTVTRFMCPMLQSRRAIAIKVFWLLCLPKFRVAKFQCLPA